METLQIQVSTELFQRLQPYQTDWAKLLELGLRYFTQETPLPFDLEQYKLTEEYQEQKRLHEIMRQNGVIVPDLDTRLKYVMHPDNQNRQPIKAGGKPASQIIIEQRRGILEDE
jgi:hypothetical protein